MYIREKSRLVVGGGGGGSGGVEWCAALYGIWRLRKSLNRAALVSCNPL